MAGESQQTPDAKPDPTVMTTELIDRAVKAETEKTEEKLNTLRERLNSIDQATTLRLDTINHLPAVVDEKVGHLAEMMRVELKAIAQQFAERDTRSERESRDNVKAVDAAFAAQKEAAAKEGESNQKAIDKSEKATSETIKTNQEVSNKVTDALRDQLNDLKTRVDRMEAQRNGSIEQRTETRQSNAAFYALVGVGLSVILAGITIIGFIAANSPG